MRRLTCLLVCLLLSCSLNGSAVQADDARLPPPASRPIDFVKDVQPIFAAACYSCHGSEKQKSSYRLDAKASALASGDIGKAIIPGKSAESPLIQYVAGLEADLLMPAEGERLSEEQVGILRAWIDQGANWPDAADVQLDTKPHWSLLPLAKPAIPKVHDTGSAPTPVDAFLMASLEARGMRFSPPTDRPTLLRRVSFDLVGLPPTPEEVAAFRADTSPNAYEKVVDRLLASPHYGERWARHWMDVVHFAETHGNDQDRPRPNAWPYRDYLIRSFNADKPYPRFLQEQVAGDALFPQDSQAIVALGMLAAGPWDESSQMGILDDTVDKKIAQVLDRDDMISTVMSAFCGATVHCARCHNHKFDPFSQADYYSLQAVFAGVDRAERPFDSDALVARQRLELAQRKRQIDSLDVRQLVDNSMLAEEIVKLEKAFNGNRNIWKVLSPTVLASASGSTGTTQPDGSILYSGTRPERDTYTLTLETDLDSITAVQVEVLTDDSLPHEGPGRQDNGNLHLSEFKLRAVLATDGAAKPVEIASAQADFSQTGWDVGRAIDGNPATAWGIYPEVGKSHTAVFTLRQPLQTGGRAQLEVILEQLHGGGHLVGRPRVSATGATNPAAAAPVPTFIAAILAVSPAERTPAQKLELARFLLGWQVERDLASLPPPQMVYAATSNFTVDGNFKPSARPRPVHVLRRGDINQPLSAAEPGALSCCEGLASRFELSDAGDESARRAALARWLVDEKNVLTWRTIVNRVWHYHFGGGICNTPNDLGRMGGQPSHPELLDWLAVEFRDSGGSLKKLHRQLVTTAAYQQSSGDNAENARLDADNRFLWRMNRTRLDAESIRDSVLAISGKLDKTMGGPSVKQFVQTPGIHVTPVVDYRNYDVDHKDNYRMSIYRFLFRTLPDPFMESLDCPDASQSAPVRAQSVTALQALSMLNNRLLVRQSEHTAARLSKLSIEPQEQLRHLFLLALSREPTADELQLWGNYVVKHGLANACRLMFNTNEFVFVN